MSSAAAISSRFTHCVRSKKYETNSLNYSLASALCSARVAVEDTAAAVVGVGATAAAAAAAVAGVVVVAVGAERTLTSSSHRTA